MKLQLFVACLVVSSFAFGQFIPQPTGYNPDENGDNLIGVNDLQGLLALYGNAFDNGDSTISVFEAISTPSDTVEIDENTDLVYITTDLEDNDEFTVLLPQGGVGFKYMMVFINNVSNASGSTVYVRMIHENPLCVPSGFCERAFLGVNGYDPECFVFVRGEDGVWYRVV